MGGGGHPFNRNQPATCLATYIGQNFIPHAINGGQLERSSLDKVYLGIDRVSSKEGRVGKASSNIFGTMV